MDVNFFPPVLNISQPSGNLPEHSIIQIFLYIGPVTFSWFPSVHQSPPPPPPKLHLSFYHVQYYFVYSLSHIQCKLCDLFAQIQFVLIMKIEWKLYLNDIVSGVHTLNCKRMFHIEGGPSCISKFVCDNNENRLKMELKLKSYLCLEFMDCKRRKKNGKVLLSWVDPENVNTQLRN